MADLKIPNLNKNSNKFFFKKKFKLRRKNKRKIIRESFYMFSFGLLIIYLNYLIPNKKIIIGNFFENFNNILSQIMELLKYLYEICLVIFIIGSLISALILMLGAFVRFFKIVNKKSQKTF